MSPQTLAGHRAPRYLESYIPSNEAAGGIADRLLGTATAALYAIITRRALVIHWDNPMPFDLLFDSPLGIDWSYPYFPPSESAHPFFGAKENIADRLKIYAMQWKKKPLDGLFSKTKWLDLSSKWVRVSGWVCLFYRTLLTLCLLDSSWSIAASLFARSNTRRSVLVCAISALNPTRRFLASYRIYFDLDLLRLTSSRSTPRCLPCRRCFPLVREPRKLFATMLTAEDRHPNPHGRC